MKTALITGASRGIGAETAIKLAADGFIVYINYFSSEKNALCIAKQTGGIALQADVSDMQEVSNMVDRIIADYGHIDVLVNNAAISYVGLFNDITSVQENRIIDVNIKGVFNCSRAVLPHMIRRKKGKIINISSMWGETGASCEVHYSTSKAAVIGFTKSLAKEVAPSGINVNCVSPGFVLTDMNNCFTEETLNQICEETPLGRLGKPQDIAESVSFFASEKSDFITGQVISVNGGLVI